MVRCSGLHVASLALDRLETLLAPDAPPRFGFYEFVSLPLGEFLAGLEVCNAALLESTGCWPSEGYRFIDVGCGIGTKLAMAHHAGYRVTGIDHEPAYLDVARRVCPEATLREADAFTYDTYDAFDVVFSYRLCVSDGVQSILTGHIVRSMRPGALLFAAGWDPIGLEPVGDSVWRVAK